MKLADIEPVPMMISLIVATVLSSVCFSFCFEPGTLASRAAVQAIVRLATPSIDPRLDSDSGVVSARETGRVSSLQPVSVSRARCNPIEMTPSSPNALPDCSVASQLGQGRIQSGSPAS